MVYIICNIQNMKSVNENENMQQNWFLMNLLNYIVAASFIFIEFISNYPLLGISKKIKSIIDLYLNYRNESGFSTHMTTNFRKNWGLHVIRSHSGSRKIRKCRNMPIRLVVFERKFCSQQVWKYPNSYVGSYL